MVGPDALVAVWKVSLVQIFAQHFAFHGTPCYRARAHSGGHFCVGVSEHLGNALDRHPVGEGSVAKVCRSP